MPTKAEKEGWKVQIPSNKLASRLDIPQFDLQRLNMVQIAEDLSQMLNSPAPQTWLGKWFGNKKIRLDNERVTEISEYISRIRLINENVTNLQAELVLSPSVLQGIIDGHFAKAKREAELQIKFHLDQLKQIDDQAAARGIQLDRAKAEIEDLRANTHLTKIKGRLLEKIVDELNIDSISASQAFVLVKALNPNANAEYGAQDAMIAEQLEKMKVENRKSLAQARREEYQADLEGHNVQAQIRENADSK